MEYRRTLEVVSSFAYGRKKFSQVANRVEFSLRMRKKRDMYIMKIDTVQAIEDKRRYFAEKQREWRALNPDRAKEIQRRYYETHGQERIDSSLRRRYRANRAKALQIIGGQCTSPEKKTSTKSSIAPTTRGGVLIKRSTVRSQHTVTGSSGVVGH